MDKLPNELIGLIIERLQQTALLPTNQDWRQRSTTLTTLALVARRWTAPAQQWLNSDVWLSSNDMAQAFRRSAAVDEGAVRSLRVDFMNPKLLRQLIAQMKNLRSLHIGQGEHDVDKLLGQPSLSSESTCQPADPPADHLHPQDLKNLVLHCYLTVSRSTPTPLPFTLRLLELRDSRVLGSRPPGRTTLFNSSFHQLTYLSLPAMDVFSVDEARHAGHRQAFLHSVVAAAAPSLTTLGGLCTLDTESPVVMAALRKGQSLRRLEWSTTESARSEVKKLSTVLSAIPSQLETLDLTFYDNATPFARLRPLLELPALKNLKSLVITASEDGDEEQDREEADDGTAEREFKTRLAEMGIDLDLEVW